MPSRSGSSWGSTHRDREIRDLETASALCVGTAVNRNGDVVRCGLQSNEVEFAGHHRAIAQQAGVTPGGGGTVDGRTAPNDLQRPWPKNFCGAKAQAIRLRPRRVGSEPADAGVAGIGRVEQRLARCGNGHGGGAGRRRKTDDRRSLAGDRIHERHRTTLHLIHHVGRGRRGNGRRVGTPMGRIKRDGGADADLLIVAKAIAIARRFHAVANHIGRGEGNGASGPRVKKLDPLNAKLAALLVTTVWRRNVLGIVARIEDPRRVLIAGFGGCAVGK